MIIQRQLEPVSSLSSANEDIGPVRPNRDPWQRWEDVPI
jgi:hypothetical protein